MEEIRLREALDEYKTVYMPYRNFAQRTREEYMSDLEGFINFVEKSGVNHAGEIGLPAIQRYMAYLEQIGFASSTRKRKTISIRSFLTFLYQNGHLASNIAKQVIVPFVDTSTPRILTQTECDRLRQVCTGSARDRAIIELLIATGVKLSELVSLTVDDVEFGVARGAEERRGYLRVVGVRGKRDRVVPFGARAWVTLKAYLFARRDIKRREVFLNRFGEPLGERGVQKILKRYLKKAGLRQASIHTLRHTFGAYHARKGTDPKIVRDVMGLKDVRSAAIYQALAREVVSRELQENSL